MFQTLQIDNFRGLRHFNLSNLSRVNLLVGANNSGKTSILEAIELLCCRNYINMSLPQLMKARGEYYHQQNINVVTQQEFDICHLFYGHKIHNNICLSIIGKNETKEEKLILKVTENPQLKLPLDEDEFDNLDFVIEGTEIKPNIVRIPLTDSGGISLNDLRKITKINLGNENQINSKFITPFSLSSQEMIKLFDQVVLTPNEKVLIECLQIIEPKINRIATVSMGENQLNFGERKGFKVLLNDHSTPIPIGSLGDGVWRMLALILAMVNVKNGVLLIDEIDSGLHFSTLSEMWQLIIKIAENLNIQVFATTHNSDCVNSLADVINENIIDSNNHTITIHRIEFEQNKSIVFNQKQIVIAAERGIEVR